MTRQQYDADCTARAVEWVARQTKPARVMADELGVPRQTLLPVEGANPPARG